MNCSRISWTCDCRCSARSRILRLNGSQPAQRNARHLQVPGNVEKYRPALSGRKRVIPGAFQYHRPGTLSEAVSLLADLGEEARPIAGGHSLIPMMKLRLATPEHLVDLGALGELRGIATEGNDIVIGAMTSQHELIASELLRTHLPILRETSLQIADPQVRYMGTIGGNLANGDPGNDMPGLMLCLDAQYRVVGKSGERRVPAREFYQGAYFTALAPGEIVAAVHIPIPPPGHGWAYEKLKRKIGDYATAAAAVVLTLDGGAIGTCAIGLTNVAETPLLAEQAAALLVGSRLERDRLAAAMAAAEAIAEPAADGRGSVEYRTKMAGVMLARAAQRAFARAQG
jgi:aerobic carbon-monoxide dehydrogenase medium subunit